MPEPASPVHSRNAASVPRPGRARRCRAAAFALRALLVEAHRAVDAEYGATRPPAGSPRSMTFTTRSSAPMDAAKSIACSVATLGRPGQVSREQDWSGCGSTPGASTSAPDRWSVLGAGTIASTTTSSLPSRLDDQRGDHAEHARVGPRRGAGCGSGTPRRPGCRSRRSRPSARPGLTSSVSHVNAALRQRVAVARDDAHRHPVQVPRVDHHPLVHEADEDLLALLARRSARSPGSPCR